MNKNLEAAIRRQQAQINQQASQKAAGQKIYLDMVGRVYASLLAVDYDRALQASDSAADIYGTDHEDAKKFAFDVSPAATAAIHATDRLLERLGLKANVEQ